MGASDPQIIRMDIPSKLYDVLQLDMYHYRSYSAVAKAWNTRRTFTRTCVDMYVHTHLCGYAPVSWGISTHHLSMHIDNIICCSLWSWSLIIGSGKLLNIQINKAKFYQYGIHTGFISYDTLYIVPELCHRNYFVSQLFMPRCFLGSLWHTKVNLSSLVFHRALLHSWIVWWFNTTSVTGKA